LKLLEGNTGENTVIGIINDFLKRTAIVQEIISKIGK
jgi:hypothetical protein